jgi:hypothetical protein
MPIYFIDAYLLQVLPNVSRKKNGLFRRTMSSCSNIDRLAGIRPSASLGAVMYISSVGYDKVDWGRIPVRGGGEREIRWP